MACPELQKRLFVVDNLWTKACDNKFHVGHPKMFLGELAKIWPGQTDRARLPSLRRRLPGQVRKPPQTSPRRTPQRVRRIGCPAITPQQLTQCRFALQERLASHVVGIEHQQVERSRESHRDFVYL